MKRSRRVSKRSKICADILRTTLWYSATKLLYSATVPWYSQYHGFVTFLLPKKERRGETLFKV